MLSLPTLAHPLSNADESPTTKQTRHAMAPSDVRRLPNGYPLPWAKRRQSMTLGGYQRMIADNCCRKSSNRSLAVIVATDETADGHREGTWMSVLCHSTDRRR